MCFYSKTGQHSEPTITTRSEHAAEPAQDTDLRIGAPPSYRDAVRLITPVPAETSHDPPAYVAPEPPKYSTQEQPRNPEASLPPYSVWSTDLSHPLTVNTGLAPPESSNTEVSVSHPPAASNAGELRSTDLSHPSLTVNTGLAPPQSSNTEVSVSCPPAATSDAGELRTSSASPSEHTTPTGSIIVPFPPTVGALNLRLHQK